MKLNKFPIYPYHHRRHFPDIFNIARNISVLQLSKNVIVGAGEDFELPNLRQLRIEGFRNIKVLYDNAQTVEILSINASDGYKWEKFDKGQSFPNLELLACEYDDREIVEVLEKLLEAKTDALKHLLLRSRSNDGEFSDEEFMEYDALTIGDMTLTSIVFDNFSERAQGIVDGSIETLETIAINMEEDHMKAPDLPPNLPQLKEIVLTATTKYKLDIVMGQSYIQEMRETYPHAKIRVEKTDDEVSYANAVMKKHGADKLMNLSGKFDCY